MKKKHWAIYVKNKVNIAELLSGLLYGEGFPDLSGQQVAVFSKYELERLIDEEDRHDRKIIAKDTTQTLISMSSGEQKKALLQHVLGSNPDYILLANPFDNLDTVTRKELTLKLTAISGQVGIVQLLSRKQDLLPFITQMALFDEGKRVSKVLRENDTPWSKAKMPIFQGKIPEPLVPVVSENETLISFKNVSVHYDGKPILNGLHWEVKTGEFWQLVGRNGTGKTTMFTMITGDNPKAYGQDIHIFGQRKGSGESVWEIKNKIGYYTPSMTTKFTGYHTVEFMLISGFFDSIGLYTAPTERQRRLAKEWLLLIGMWEIKDSLFHELSVGQQRLLMVTRAMVKQPVLLILDEPTVDLDDENAALFVALVNKIADESQTAIIFVSHREEQGLKPQYTYELLRKEGGSIGRLMATSKE